MHVYLVEEPALLKPKFLFVYSFLVIFSNVLEKSLCIEDALSNTEESGYVDLPSLFGVLIDFYSVVDLIFVAG